LDLLLWGWGILLDRRWTADWLGSSNWFWSGLLLNLGLDLGLWTSLL
jgi:hypothetical protein